LATVEVVGLNRHPGQRGQIVDVIKELRPHRRDYPLWGGDRVARQLSESPPGVWGRPGKQLLGLVDPISSRWCVTGLAANRSPSTWFLIQT
jgi:hypothetical protein